MREWLPATDIYTLSLDQASLYDNNIKVATHADLTDDNQTLYIPKTLEISIAKADKDNIKYFLKGAEITIYDKDGNVAIDTEGNECIGITDKNGLVKFSIFCKEDEYFYAKETKCARFNEIELETNVFDNLEIINY